MKALILSGGMGKRLRPLTDYVPKPLIPVNTIPIVEWQIRYFKKFGVNEFVICAGYKNEQIINYLKPKQLGIKLDFSIEKNELGTGGAIKNASKLIDSDNFFVINGDVITNIDPRKLKNRPNSIAVIPLRTSFGLVNIQSTRVLKFEEKPQIKNQWMNAGIYCLSKEILKHLPKKGNIEKTTFPFLATKGMLYVVKYEKSFWHSVDSYKDIELCENEIKSTNYEKFLFEK